MAAVQSGVRFDKIAQKWHALAQRRLVHVRELEHSGRWKNFYTEEQFGEYRREAERIAALWRELAGVRPGLPAGGGVHSVIGEPPLRHAASSRR